MSSTVTNLTVQTIMSNDYTATSTTIGLVAVALLIILLLIDSMRRAGDAAPNDLRGLAVGIVPLLIAANSIIGGRLASLL